jgi:hypothetical protein
MKDCKKVITLVFCMLSILSYGQQEYAFKVLVNKGKNEVKSGNNWILIKTGSSLKPDDELKIAENSYVGLVHVTGRPLEVKQAGKYKIVDLAARVSGGQTVLNKYTDFILSTNTQKKNNLAATGAVHRGAENIKVNLPKPEFAIVYNTKVIVTWETSKVPGPYVIWLNSMFGDELTKIESKENSITLDLNDAMLANEDNILIKVTSKADPNKVSDEYSLKRVSRADINRIKSSLNEIKDQVAEETALNKLVLAGFYEQNGLLIDAGTAHQEAIRLAPDVPEYKESYENFLLRNNIKEAAGKK